MWSKSQHAFGKRTDVPQKKKTQKTMPWEMIVSVRSDRRKKIKSS